MLSARKMREEDIWWKWSWRMEKTIAEPRQKEQKSNVVPRSAFKGSQNWQGMMMQIWRKILKKVRVNEINKFQFEHLKGNETTFMYHWKPCHEKGRRLIGGFHWRSVVLRRLGHKDILKGHRPAWNRRWEQPIYSSVGRARPLPRCPREPSFVPP